MKPSRVNFAPRTGVWHALVVPLGVWGLLVLALAGVTVSLDRLRLAGQHVREEQQTLTELSQRPARAMEHATTRGAAPLTATQTGQINGAVRQLNIPWSDVLDGLESAKGARIAVMDLTPDAASRRMRGTAEARTSAEMIAFVTRLKRQDIFLSADIVSHQINVQDRNKPLRFEFSVEWRET